MRGIFFAALLLVNTSSFAESFKVGLANIFFWGALYENNVKKPLFKPLSTPPDREKEIQFDELSLEYLARYINYLDADVLVLCEVPSDPTVMEDFNRKYLNDRYALVHNFPVVKNKKYYFNQQVAAFVDKSKFVLRRYEATDPSQVTEDNKLYPFPENRKVEFRGKMNTFWWSRFPVEFDVALKSSPEHWYKFIGTYPKSKHSSSKEGSLKARMQNYVQQSMIRTRIEAVSEEFEDIFVLGDMNDIPGMDEPEKELGFDSISALYKGEKDPILWNPVRYYPGEGTFIYKGEAGVLDYIFVSKGLKKGKGVVYEKYSEHFHFFKTMILHNKDPRPDRMKNMELFLSDHAPVTIEVYSDLK